MFHIYVNLIYPEIFSGNERVRINEVSLYVNVIENAICNRTKVGKHK